MYVDICKFYVLDNQVLRIVLPLLSHSIILFYPRRMERVEDRNKKVSHVFMFAVKHDHACPMLLLRTYKSGYFSIFENDFEII